MLQESLLEMRPVEACGEVAVVDVAAVGIDRDDFVSFVMAGGAR